jgi:tetratricopeptide (TPR) repeat protein
VLEQILRARHHLTAGELDAAEALVRESKHEADALHILGMVNLRRGELAAAEALLRRAIERDGAVAAYHNDLGNALQDRGRLQDAIACYRRALRLHPGFAEAWNDLGTARYAKGELEAARECYREALRLRPDHVVAHANLGAVCRKLGLLGSYALQRGFLRLAGRALAMPRRLDLNRPARRAALAQAQHGSTSSAEILPQALASPGNARASTARGRRPGQGGKRSARAPGGRRAPARAARAAGQRPGAAERARAGFPTLRRSRPRSAQHRQHSFAAAESAYRRGSKPTAHLAGVCG